MKTATRPVSLVIAAIAAFTVALFAAAPQPPKPPPTVFTIKADGKAIAELTLLFDGQLKVSGGDMRWTGKQGQYGTTTFTGSLTVTLLHEGQQAAFEIKADEIQMPAKGWKLPEK